MKIWIVSSKPYLEEWEKMIAYWPEGTEYTISPVYNFGLNFFSTRNFLKTYKEISPDIILADHGYMGFLLVKIFSFLKRRKLNLFFFLRGNYWLEKKNYSKDINKINIEYFDITVKTNAKNLLKFSDPHEIIIPYFTKEVKGEIAKYEYRNIWSKNHIFTAGKKKTSISLTKKEKVSKNDLDIEIEKINGVVKRRGFALLKEHLRIYFQKIGWSVTIRYSTKLISVCKYLKGEVEQHTKNPIVICPIGVEMSELDSKNRIKLKHPSICLIQNHQIKEKSEVMVSFKDIIMKFPEVTFYISRGLPENRDNRNYRNVMDTLEGLKNVEFADILAHNKMAYLREADLYVLRSGLDCTPATVIEASIAGKPTIASKIGGVPEMIIDGETGWTIENDNSKEWINKIDFLIKNPEEAEKMGKRAEKYAKEKYDMKKVALDFYQIVTT